MKKHLFLFASLLWLLSSPLGAQQATFAHMVSPMKHTWHKAQQTALEAPATDAEAAVNAFGALQGPNGQTWTYTLDFTEKSKGFYSAAHVKVYNEKQELVGEFTDTFAEGDSTVVGVNSVQLNPLITKKFFNMDDNYEVMLYVHAVTKDYTGLQYNDVFSLGKPDKICTIPGNQVLAQNTARDAWSENYTLVFQRDSTVMDEIESDEPNYGEYYLLYDVYQKAGYGGFKGKVHTFTLDYSYIAGAGHASVPILMQKHNNKIVYAFARYEKPFFDPNTPWNQDPVVQPNNNFLITMVSERFDTIAQTKIPCPTDNKYLYTFPYLGGLRYNDDLAFNFFESDTAYIVSFDYYTTSDDFLTSYYVYNVAGECLDTIAEYTSDYIWMSDVAGQEEQYCFVQSDDQNVYFSFVDVPSCKEVARFNSLFNGNQLSANLDRYPVKDSYQYVFSLTYGADDAEGNTIHSVAWLKKDGSLDHYDRLNLGKNIQLANPYISADALNPWLFNTDNEREYMVLVKRQISAGSPKTNELLYIVNTKGDRLLELGPDAIKGNLSGISLLNPKTNPHLAILYYNSGAGANYTPTYTSLPLNKFAGGDGTAANPYLIATAGDFQQIGTAPSATFQVIDDLDFQSLPFSGISADFTGSIDGKDHVLTNVVLADNGLFRNVLEVASIKNLRIYQPELTLNNGSEVGIVANSMVTNTILGTGESTIENVHVYRPVVNAAEGYDGIFGGIVGSTATGSQVIQCSVNGAEINMGEDAIAGGIVGKVTTGSVVKGCAFSGELTAGVVGGIVGESQTGDETITHCHSNAALTGYETTGGIIGNDGRSIINNCYAEGSILAKGGNRGTAAGGIAGKLESTFAASAQKVIENCLVGIDSIVVVPGAEEITAHRIVGYSSVDEKEIDWEKTTDWENPVYLESNPETALGQNYVVSTMAVLDALVQATDTTTEGATLATADLTTDFLTNHKFAAGTALEAPWVHGANPYLWFEKETGVLIAGQAEMSVLLGDSAEVSFSILNGDGAQIKVACDANGLVSWRIVEAEQDYAVVRVVATACGTATLTATYGDKTTTCRVVCHREYLGQDSEKGSVNQTYTDADKIALEDMRGTLGVFLFSAEKADGSDKVLLYFFNENEDEDIIIPAQTYTIDKTYKSGTVAVSTGLDANAVLAPSYYTTLNKGTAKEVFFFVAGEVKVEKLADGAMQMTVDAVNSYNLPIHIEYKGTPTDIDNVRMDDSVETYKFVKDGVIYIIRNNHIYTTTGELVK